MLIVTKKLRAHAAEHFSVAADASDDDVRNAVSKALVEGKITPDALAELTKAEASDAENRINTMVSEAVSKAVGDSFAEIRKALGIGQNTGGDGAAATATVTKGHNVDGQQVGDQGGQSGSQTPNDAQKAYMGAVGTPGTGDADVRVKSVIEQYSHNPTAATYEKSSNHWTRKAMGAHSPVVVGQPGDANYRALDMPTERTKAIAGAWMKMMLQPYIHRLPRSLRMTEHDREIVKYIMHECKFVGGFDVNDKGESKYEYTGQKMLDLHRKAVLDEAGGSQGLEAVPIEFDDVAILTPLLNGELFPLVRQRTVSRRRIEGFSVGNPTLTWQAQEQSAAIPVFNTAAFVAAFDTNIYVVNGSIEIGMDFEADSPVAIGDIILNRYGERYQQEMDNVIATGSGSGQPTGILTTAGATVVVSANNTTGPPVVGDYEGLLFAVPKEFRQESMRDRQVFLANDVTYRRVRGLPVGAADARRIFGMDEESYRLFDHPYKINGTVVNTKAAFACLDRYRMYRRAGFSVRLLTEDRDLALQNLQSIIVRARVGGQMELGGAVAICNTMQS